MAIDRTKLQRMYKLMADNGYTQDYNTFEKKFTGNSNYANRKAVYDLFTKNGADLGGSYEEFMRKLQKPRATKPQQQPKTALGRAQQSVAQEKWGGGVVTHENTTAYESASAPMENDSELVRGLKNADAVQRLQAPVSYTKPGAVKQMVKQTRERQHVVGQNVEQAGREFTNRERDRRNAPAFDLGNEDVNNNLVKTRGQLEDELEESSRQLVDKQLGGYINNSIQKMFKDATVKGAAAEDALSKASPFAYMAAGKAYNEALDPDKLMNQLSKNAEKDMAGLFSDPKMQKEIAEKAASLGIDPEDYVKNYIAPGLQAKIAEEFEKSELSRNMPKSTAEYIIRGVNDSMIGTILSMGMMSKKQRQYAQQGMAMTDNGENPYVKPGMGARVARGTLSFAADAPVFGALGKAGAAVAGKVMGNGVAQAARIANTSLRGRIVRMATAGAVSQGVTGVLYGSTNAAVQNYSTGDDTSIGNTVKLMTMGGLSEGASWATMGGIGGVVGGSLYNVSGLKRIPAKVFQIAMEGVGMHMGGNVAKMIEGHDTDWLSVEGNLEACANVVALKLTHARLPKRYAKDGKKESYLDMVKRNLANLMVSDGQRASFGGYTFTNEEKEQLFGSNKAPLRKMYERLIEDMPLRPEGFTHWALRTKKTTARGKGEESYKDTDAEFVKTAYDEIMADNTIPWDTKAKFSALVMGTVPSSRPMMEYIGYGGGTISEYSKYGELLSEHIVKTEDERDSVVYSLRLRRENQRLSNAYGAAQIKDEKTAQETLETVAETFGFTAEQLKAAMDKDPLKRSEEEQNVCVALRKAYEGEQFPEGTLHPEQSQTEGKDVVEENNLGTENPNNEAVAEVLNNMNNAEKAFNAALESNDVLKQEYERLTKEGLSEPQIYMELFNSGLTQEQLAPFADYINAKAKAVGMYRGTEQKIAETVQKHVEQWSYKGELNGEKQDGGQMLFVKDNNGRLLIVGAGDVAFDSEGRARESIGDMLSVLDPNTKEMDFVSKKDVQLDHVEKTEDYAKNYQTMLEEKNSVAYAESEKVKEKSEKTDTKTESVVTPKEGASVPGVEDVKPIGEGEKKNPSDNGNGSNETLTFADGSPVPMMKDTKGRETADYSQMTPEHGAEWMSSQFGENAEAAVDGQIKRAEKLLKEAEKIKVDYTGDLNDAKEAEAQKAKAVNAAKAELELYTNIKKVMTANKVKAGMEKVGAVGEEGSVSEAGNLGAVREKFESGKRIVGNKRTRTLADGSKLRGHYEIVEADSLTPSHNANDGYKKSEGFPVNEEGRTINDRDYENDKQAQMVTDMIAMKYDGQAVDQVPVVTTDGIVVDGNGRTMAGQKAAKDGTDGAYLEALKENAENYGFTAEQIEQSGLKHPRLVLVSDEPMKYDTATFAKFNKNEKKSQGNTQQAVANSKKLSADEIGAIVSEIEGSGSLDAFFNNPSAINSLLTRLVDKGVIGLNEVAGLREGENKLSASGKDFVKNLLLGSVFSENTIRMMGADAMLKTKALNGIRAVTDNMKLGDYALMKEIDQAVQLLYEARQGGSGVDAYLRTPAMFGENAADRFDPISQAIALALEGKAEDFRELMMAYNRNAAPYADASQTEMFGERPTKEDFVNEFLKLRNWKDYETRHSSKEGNGDAGSSEGTEPQARGGSEPTEGQREVDEAVKHIATEITKKTGIEVVTDEKTAQEAIEKSESAIRENRRRWAGGKVVGMKQLPDGLQTDPDMLWSEISQYHGDYLSRKLENIPEDGTVNFFSAHDGKWFFYSIDKDHTINLFDAVEASRDNYDLFKDKLKKYGFDSTTRTGRDGLQEAGYTGRTDGDKFESFIRPGIERSNGLGDGKAQGGRRTDRRGMAGEADGTQLEGDSEKQGEIRYFRTANGEVYGFTDGEKIYLDTKKMKPETPLHEYAHLWCDMLRRVNPKEWENVKKLFDEVEGLKDEVQKLYPELEGDALYEEMITTYSGREGTKKLEDVVRKLAAEDGKSVTESAKAHGFLEKVKEALTKYWKGVADVLGIHFTTAEEVADKVLADWAKGVDPRESEKGKEKSEKSDSVVTPKGDKKGDIKDATAPKGDKTKEEPSKTNPLAWLAHTAEMYKDEQVQKAKEELAKAKESGDASDIKRATADMKQAMETKLRGNGIGLVERRRIIGRELGKILGEEAGKTEAEKIDKPWEQMDLEEREAVSSKNPLTETEINELTSEENRELIPAALAYLRGDKGNIINAISYFKIWNDVRSRHENVPDNSGTKDGTQLDAPNTGGSQELGLGRGREGGGPNGPVDRTDGERTTPGERESGTGGENDTPVSTGKPRVDKGEGNTPGMDAVSAGSTDTRGGGGAGNEGNVPKRGGQGGDNRPLDPNAERKPAAKQGTHFPDSTSERLKQERAEYEQKKKDFWERWKKAGQGYMKISLTPFKALNLSPEQIEMLPELFKMHLNGAVLKIKEGIYKFNEWKAAMRAEEGEELKMIGLSDDDIDRFIEDYWNTPYQMDGETHTIGEWAGIHGNEKLRNKLSEPLNDKYQRQVDAEPIKVKIGDKKNIEETLPYLLPQQQEDVLKAETQFFGNEHADREHAYGKGYMFTNGTGTGKTFTGLGIAKRLVKQGKGRILIVTPSQKKVSDWIKDGRNLNMEIRDLDSWAKDRGTTATTESGEGVVITTFANFGVNKKLLETKWDAVIYDESHRIMENKNGAETARSMQHYMMTNRSENHCFLRLQETNADYQKMKSLSEQFNAERDKEVKRIQDEYKASHPSATARDISYATSKALPKEIINFTPGDYASFPKLGEIHSEFKKAFSHYINEVMPKLEAQAKSEWKDTKTIFLSATPFNTRENLDYVEGYIFKYPEVENSGRMSGRTQFYLDHFGAAYKFRYGRLEQSTSNPEAVAKQEIEFSDYLQHTLGTMSGRIIDSPYDYSRDFPTVSPDHAERFNQAVQEAIGGHGVLADAYRKTIGDYTYGSALFETMKVANIIERIKAHLGAGRKVVIFHRRVESKEPLKPPFALMLDRANFSISLMNPGEEKNEAIQAVRAFRKKYADLLKWEQTLDYSMPREQIAKVFGKDNVLFFSGKESSKVKDKAVDTFNDDNSGKNIIVIQEASGKEGISLHDKTGEHQRVCITLALPQSPITALQIEGRTYRIGNKSNAIFEYPILGLNSEMMLFGQKFNNQVSTTENLALGSQARSLRDSFANGILEHSGVVPIDQQGVGGKEFDAPKDQSTDGFDNAVLDYYSNQKLNSRNREGVDYFPTPEPLGYKMMEWANMGEGDTVMEPSAGHGAIARYAPKGNQMVAIEPSQSLFAKLQLKAGGLGRKFQNTIFENYDIGNKHDVVVMNPPFGTAGTTAIAHLGKAFKHLEEGGRVVAIIPRGSTDKKFEKWIDGEKTAVMRAEVELPDIVFKQAGTKVVCRVVVVDKISNEAMRAKAGRVEKVSLGGHYDKIEDFFEDLRDVEMPDRIIDTNTIMQKKSKQTAKDLKELKDVTVNLNEHGINVRVRGDRNDYSIMFDLGEYNAEQRKSILSGTYERFEEYERYTRDETSQAVIAELKKLSCKLAGMTEEEMQRYLKKKYEGKGVMENIAHSAEVYNNAKKLRFQKAPKEEQSEELYLSLQNKKGKEYYDTVDILSERIADGRADIRGLSERPGRKETNRISAGIEIIAASRDKQNEAGTAKSNETKLRLGRVATEKAIEEWAKSNDAVFAEEDIAKGAMDGKPSAEGGEAVVYVSDNFSKVTKLVDPYPRNNGSIQLCMENTRLFNRLFPDAAYTVKGVARDKNGKFRIVMEQPYLEGKQYGEDTMAEYENGPSQAKDALMESLGLHDVYGDGLEFRNDKYYVSDLHPGNIVFDSEGQPHVIDADVKYYGVFRRNNIEGKPLIVDNEAKEPKTDARSSEEFFKSLKDKEGKEYYDAVTELAERMAGRTGRKEESVSEGQSQPRETSVGRNTERIVGRPKSVVHCAAEIIATDTERSYGNGGLQQSERGLERGEKNALVPREKSSQSEVSTAGVWENRVSDPVEREISKRIEAWAKQTNHWFDWRNLRTKYDRTKQLGDGTEAESDVFLSKDGKTVLKVVRNPHALYTSLLGKLNSIALHNKLFGDVGQTIIGITRTTETDALGKDVSTIGLLIEQPFVEGKPVADVFNNYGEEIAYIDKTMTDLGFKPEKWADNGGYFNGEPETVWRKDDVIVYDTHGNNIFIDKNGKPRLIDCGIKTYKDYAKRHTLYDSAKAREAEYENAVRAVKSEIRALEKEVLNEERLIAMLRDNRREDNADKIDGFINHHEEKIAELKHKIRINAQALQKPNSVHYRTEPTEPLADGASAHTVSERIIKTVEKAAEKTGGKVKMVNTVEEIGNEQVRRDIENGKQVTGWYDEKTGEVHLYMPNIHDTYTAEKTVWHETVGHKGMRGLLGDKFNDYMRSLWMDLDNPINAELRAYVKEKMNMNHLGFYDAIEEFIAKSAEDGKGEPGFWNYIKNKVTDALHEIGYRVSPNVKDVKYMLWLAKNVQKHGDSPLWKMRAEAVRWKIEHEKTEYTKIEGGELYDNDGKSHDFEGMSREEWLEATDGEIHYRTAPNAATALDRYHHALDRHSYMATEAFMDNMLSLKKLMEAIDPSIRRIEDVNSSMNPYLMQNITEGMMSDKSKLFEIRYMDPLSKAMSSVLDSFDGKKVEDRIRNFNLYMIRMHGLERNRVLFVRDKIREERKVKSEESDSIDALETAWKDERSDLRQKLDSGQIDLREYYRQMDEWIVQNLDKDFKAEEHDYSGMHGLQGIDDMKSPYDDAGAIDEVMSQEASMESMKKGSVADFWKKVKAATDYSVNSDYESGLISQITHDGVLDMFDWYVPLRKFDEATAEDVYGYVTEMGDPSNYIGTTLMNAKGRKSLSNVEILAQIGLMGNRAIRNGGQNMIKQAFARFVRNSGEQNLVKETKVWVEKTGTDLNGNDIWEEAYPQIPEGASADDVASIVDAFETDMRTKQAKGEAKSLSNGTDIGFKFQRAKDKSQHFVDVKIAGRTHRFVVLGNPRAAQALNGMLENGKARSKTLQTMCRWMAMASTSWSPEFVNRNSLKDFQLSSAHVLAKEGGRYAAKWLRYYGELNPINVIYNDGAGTLKSMKWKDLKNGVGFGLYARYREGTLGNSKMERYFKEFMENGGETGFVQLFSMQDMEKSYKSVVENETAKNAKGLSVKKIKVNFVEVLKQVGKDIEALNEVAENMARFATYCTSRDFGRSAARSAYDAKEVSSNFNRHGSGYGVLSFKNGEMSGLKKVEQKLYGGLSGWLKNYSMYFNAGVQSTSLLFKNIKHAPVSTGLAMMTSPFVLGLLFTLINNYKIQNEDEKDRGNVKDPYGELQEYIRRNNICYYVGKGRFVTVPLAIELRAFYGLGDLAAGQTFAKNVKSQREWAMDAVGCMSQLFPVVDFLNNPNFEKSVPNGAGMIGEAVAPTALVPIIEWYLNNDWKGAPIRRTGDKADLNPAWQNAYSNVPARLIDLNKWVNAKTNDVAPGNPEIKGNEALDMLTNPSGLSHFYDSYSSGFGTFIQRTAGLGAKVATGKTDEIEVGDVPFLRSLFYTPREQSSMARTKAKWYNYKEEMEQTIANNDKLKSKNVPTMKRIENAAALEKFEGSPEQRKVNIIKNAEKRMRHWNTMRKKWADDKKQVDFANKNIEMIMQEAVEDLDRIE